MTKQDAKRPWQVAVAVDDVPEQGRHVVAEADAATRAALAKLAGVLDISALAARFDLARHGRGGLRVTGAVEATVRQTCVVSLEPMTNVVREAVDLVFKPGAGAASPADAEAAAASGAEPPEPLVDGQIDLGAIATEFLLLGIDPYPRRPGVAFEPPADAGGKGADKEAAHPFAALGTLRMRKKS